MTRRKGPDLGRLIAAERKVGRADSNVIGARIASGAAIRTAPAMCTTAGHLRHGAVVAIGRILTAAGMSPLPAYEVRDRLQAARTYQTPDEIAWATTRFRSWTALREARFPPPERASEPGQLALVDEAGEVEPGAVVTEDGHPVQMMIVLDHPDLDRPVTVDGRSTIRQHRARLDEWVERHDRYGDMIARHLQAVGLLLAAADGDQDMTVTEAAKRLRELGGGSGKPPLPPAT